MRAPQTGTHIGEPHGHSPEPLLGSTVGQLASYSQREAPRHFFSTFSKPDKVTDKDKNYHFTNGICNKIQIILKFTNIFHPQITPEKTPKKRR